MKRTILVVGATGNQGGAVVDALLKHGDVAVAAMVRALRPAHPKQQRLVDRGVTLVQADFDDPASLASAVDGVDAVFLMTTFNDGLDAEVDHGKAMIDAAAQANVGHLVFSSVSDADKATGIPHFDSKYAIERYLVASGLTYTITAPAFFYDNLMFPWNLNDLKRGAFGQALPAGRPLQMVSLNDLGGFNAHVLTHPEHFANQRIDYAGDEVTPSQMAASLSDAIGATITFNEQTLDDVRNQFADMATMYEWFDRVGYSVDIAGLRGRYPEVDWQTFPEWARAQDWGNLLS